MDAAARLTTPESAAAFFSPMESCPHCGVPIFYEQITPTNDMREASKLICANCHKSMDPLHKEKKG